MFGLLAITVVCQTLTRLAQQTNFVESMSALAVHARPWRAAKTIDLRQPRDKFACACLELLEVKPDRGDFHEIPG